MLIKFDNTYKRLPKEFYSEQLPKKVNKPKLFCFNYDLAKNLDIEIEDESKLADYFSGNELINGSEPISQAYAGHQFGYFTMLGDGRAVLLGECLNKKNQRFDIQLKSSGNTPYSRGGDGRGTFSAMLREYLMSEAMHNLKIETTRSLAVVLTGQKVYRENINEGAVLTRVAKSHIRVGTFEYAKEYLSVDKLQTLLDYTINREYPHLIDSKNRALDFLKEVMNRQIKLIVDWMRVGFIHGVMNTDNMSISCETIDYGPCAFMNSYNPSTVFSSIDRHGRYSYKNQPIIAKWNISILANSLKPLIDKDEAKAFELIKELLDSFMPQYSSLYYSMMLKKIGIEDGDDYKFVDNLLEIMSKYELDYTNIFAMLGFDDENFILDLKIDDLTNWFNLWKLKVKDTQKAKSIMRNYNPIVIPRNHLVEEALISSSIFFELLKELKNPYDYTNQKLQIVPKNHDKTFKTFCGT